MHAGVFAIVNFALYALWAMIGGGYLWPMWVTFGWGIGLLFHAFAVFFGDRQPSEEKIQAEMDKMRGGISGPSPTA